MVAPPAASGQNGRMATKMDLIRILGDRTKPLTKDQHERLAEGKRLSASEEAELRQEVFRMTVAREHESPTLPAWVSQGMHSRGWMLIRTPIEAETIALAEVAAPEPEQAEEKSEASDEDSKDQPKSTKKSKGK